MYYSDELVEEVRYHNDIVDVVSEYVKLQKKGNNHFGLCPFHKEKTPSFSVAESKQIFYCFGCGKGGNVINFIMNIENLDYIEAVKYLADRAHIQLPDGETEEDRRKIKLKREIQEINVEAARFFYNQLSSSENKIALEYLKKRKLSNNIIKRFGLGYAPDAWDKLYKYISNKHFTNEAIEKCGLFLKNKNGGLYDRFRNRIMFPIFDVRGNVIAFGGRVMDNSLPKYVNSPDTPVYTKGKNLYALNFAKNSGTKKLLIVEGYMDVISLHQSGIINTVASLGTALTESQGRLLKKYADEVIISYDADTAGQAATMRGLDLLYDIGCNVKVMIIPNGKDPDEFIKLNGAEELKRQINNALSLVEYKVKILKKDIDIENTEDKIKFLSKLSTILSKIDNRVEREIYIEKFANEYQISAQSLYTETNRQLRPSERNYKVKTFSAGSEIKASSGRDDDNHDQLLLLAYLCNDNTLYSMVSEKLTVDDFAEEIKSLASTVFKKIEQKGGIVEAELVSSLDEKTTESFIKILQNECNGDGKKAVSDIIAGLKRKSLDKRKNEIIKTLRDNKDLTERDVEKLKQELNTIILHIARIKV